MKKSVMLTAIFFFVIAFAVPSRAVIELKELGRAPLIGRIESREKNPFDLPEKFAGAKLKISEIIKMGMGKLGYTAEKSQKIFDLTEFQIKSGNASDLSLSPGTKFAWMGYESKKSGLQVLRDVVWKGKNPIEGFEIKIQFESNEIIFFIPMDCGNFSLIGIKSIPIEHPPPIIKSIEPDKPKFIEQKKEPPPQVCQPNPRQPEPKPKPEIAPQPKLKPEPGPAPKKYYRYHYRYRYYYQLY